MSLTIEQIEAEILILPEQEQLKLIEFIESLKTKFKTKTEGEKIIEAFEKIGFSQYSENENSELSANYKDYLWGSEKPNKPLTLGLFKGQINMADDFNEPLPDSFWLEGKS